MTTGPLGRSVLDRARAAVRPDWMSARAFPASTATSSGSRHAAREGFQQEPFHDAC
ncbi:hypothetical protein GKE20_25705 [Escherichia coli]|nr:hypothetical protein [Escherichia coli]